MRKGMEQPWNKSQLSFVKITVPRNSRDESREGRSLAGYPSIPKEKERPNEPATLRTI
jgi:hypothetical protein